jgi:hypothetical protein
VVKRSLAGIFAAGYLAASLCGCAKENSASHGEKSEEPGIIHYVTGAEQLKSYRKVKSRIEDIDRTRKEQYQLE